MRGTWLSSQRVWNRRSFWLRQRNLHTLPISTTAIRYFLQLPSCPVPSFLVFDQPSQVFFPRSWPELVGALDPKLEDDDVVRVRKLFEVIAKVTTEQGHKLQTIILDHAAANVWGDIRVSN